ncbi:MAG TPA: phenylacetic acid degradation bifunctional protein PaaZ [Candidatus Baltobacteraceae bacterium]|nr:phenylacetic acid degradation bifunctional protein PaaZ [Candidatus Baltobacteraceae bacterium]
MKLRSYVAGAWYEAPDGYTEVVSAVDGHTVAQVSSRGIDFQRVLDHARRVGGPAVRALTFHQRADLIKRLALHLNEHKERFYELSFDTGATRKDGFVDIDGGVMTLFSFASKARRELPDGRVAVDGPVEPLSKGGTFAGRHIMTPLRGAAVHINAYNFPCWGMLEKLAPAIIAGVPAIVKPATQSAYVAHAVFEEIVASGVLPEGSVQLVAGSLGDLLERLTGQDVVSFTGSAQTAVKLQQIRAISENSVRFIAERDSLNAAILGSDVTPDAPEFDLFVKEVAREITTKAGQRCTCIRRAIVPRALMDAVQRALAARLDRAVLGDPRSERVTMGALVSRGQRDDVLAAIKELAQEALVVYGDLDAAPPVVDADAQVGAFLSPVVLRCDRPLQFRRVHSVEAFGPVTTLMAYDTLDEAIEIVNRGEGSLVASVFSYDTATADALVLGIAPFHGRVLVVDRDDAKEQTGHGSPLAPLVHGGPGRAGGGEEMGGIRGVFHYMQRTAVQGTPQRLATVSGVWNPGAAETQTASHPFEHAFEDLNVGETFYTGTREITLADIERFAEFTGDAFYAHMDEAAAKASPFFEGRVAHGYLVLSFAAGLFVRPQLGPVLANYGLEDLRFLKPVYPGDAMRVRLTVKEKTPRKPEYGEVRWSVTVFNQNDEVAATYDLLTMNATRAHVPALEVV